MRFLFQTRQGDCLVWGWGKVGLGGSGITFEYYDVQHQKYNYYTLHV